MRSSHAPGRDRNGRMKRQARRPRRGIQSIETGVRLLEALERVDGPLALKDVSAMAGMDPSSAHRYLASFARCGLVRQSDDTRNDLGPLALRVGLAGVQRGAPPQLPERLVA